jgi:hypothetical protein
MNADDRVGRRLRQQLFRELDLDNRFFSEGIIIEPAEQIG